jgi:hypothetical protein
MRTRTVFEIVGTIVVLATLFSSVGLSGWIYGSNLVQNGNFSEVRADNASLPADWYATAYANQCVISGDQVEWNTTLFQYSVDEGYLNITFTFENWTSEIVSKAVQFEKNKQYLISFDFKPLSGFIDASNSGFMGIYVNDTTCHSILKDYLRWNTTDVIEYGNGVFSGLSVAPLGDEWYHASAIASSALMDNEVDYGLFTFNGNLNDIKYSLDNVVLKEATYTPEPCQGWECASTARSVVGLAPIIVGLGVLVGMIAMFLMRDEEESMLALVIKGGVIALIAVVMLTILVSVIG